jgi:hypothetical protein
LTAGAITNASVGAGAIDAAAIAANAIGASELATDAVTEIVGTVSNTGGTATLGGVMGDVANISIATHLANLGGRMVSKSITYNGGASYNAFTVSGVVAVKVVGIVTSALSNEAATTSVGTATSAAGLIAATAGSAMQTEGQIWVDNAPSKFETFPANWTIISESIVVDGDASLAAGTVFLYCWYLPIQASSSVAAA